MVKVVARYSKTELQRRAELREAGLKPCNQCKEVKEFSSFRKRAGAPDGHRGACAECQKKADAVRREDPVYKERWVAYYSEYNAKRKADGSAAKYQKKYYAENQERKIESARLWYKENPKKAAATAKEYRKNNKESIAATKKKYEENHKDKIVASRKKSYRKNRESRCEYSRQWRLDNIERATAASKKYYQENRERIRAADNEKRRKWRAENPKEAAKAEAAQRAKQRGNIRRRATKARGELQDYYIKGLIHRESGVKNPPQELIEVKRVQLKIHREIKRGLQK